jgi:hypothetical protein
MAENEKVEKVEKALKTAVYTVLRRIHSDGDFRAKGETVQLTKAQAAPLLKGKFVQ